MVSVKKKWLFSLLLAACMASGTMLLIAGEPEAERLQNLEEIDTVIMNELRALGVASSKVRRRTIQVDSVFTRIHYTVSIAPRFPSTTYHMRIAHELAPLGVGISGKRTFPSRSLDLNLTYGGKLVRSVHFNVNPELEKLE